MENTIAHVVHKDWWLYHYNNRRAYSGLYNICIVNTEAHELLYIACWASNCKLVGKAGLWRHGFYKYGPYVSDAIYMTALGLSIYRDIYL